VIFNPQNSSALKGCSLSLWLLSLTVVISGCVDMTRPNDKNSLTVDDFSQQFILPNTQVKELIMRSARGDAEASYLLYIHYGFGTRDAANASKYFDKAVGFEYPLALYSKAVLLWNSGKADPKMVLKYLRRSIELGQPDTDRLLPEVEAKTGEIGKP
jgi:hypothetical protein